MATDLDRTRSHVNSRFGQLSKNMFFARHVAQPRYLKFITGTAGVQVCHVRDDVPRFPAHPSGDLAKSLISDPRFTIEFPPNSYNEALLQSYAERIEPKRRRERLLPPLPGWNPTGTVVADTENWRRELARIAEMVGLVTAEELSEIDDKKQSLVTTPPAPLSALPAMKSLASPTKSSAGEYSRSTGRWNETPRAISRSRSLRKRTPLSSIVPNHLFCVDENEREMWMLQVLCQILRTENLIEVQSWLVSSGPTEKDAVRQLISAALKGLEENGRIEPTAYFDTNTKAIQVNMDTLGSLVANKYPHVSSNQTFSSTFVSSNDPSKETKKSTPVLRPRTAPQPRPQSAVTVNGFQSKSTRVFHNNLDSIDENPEQMYRKLAVPQPTKIDSKRDVQVLTLNDDNNEHQHSTNFDQDQVPF